MSEYRPVFIGGMPHSGTTITKRILREHPDVVAFGSELHLLTDPAGLLDLYRDLTSCWTRNAANQAIYRWGEFWKLFLAENDERPNHHYTFETDLVEEYPDLAQEFTDELSMYKGNGGRPGYPSGRGTLYISPRWAEKKLAGRIREFVEELYRRRAPDADVFCEDTPENLLRFYELKEIFPNAKLVHVHRHPYDVITSLRGEWRNKNWREGFPEGRSLYTTARVYYSTMQRWWGIRSALDDDDYLEIGLEDFAEDYEQTVHELQEFVGLDDVGRMMDSPFDAERAHIGRHKPKGYGPDLTDENINEIYPPLAPICEEYGYEL